MFLFSGLKPGRNGFLLQVFREYQNIPDIQFVPNPAGKVQKNQNKDTPSSGVPGLLYAVSGLYPLSDLLSSNKVIGKGGFC